MRPPFRRKMAVPRSTTYPQLTKLRSYKMKCVCETKTGAIKSSKLLSLRESADFIDKILISSDHVEFNVHGLVMASLSPTFCTMMKPSAAANTFIPYQKEVIEVLVKLAYTGSCELSEGIACICMIAIANASWP